MQITVEPLGGNVTITGDSFDGFVFATRPSQAWPASELRHAEGTFRFELDEHGDLVDAENDPPDLSSAELGAFLEFALEHARDKLTEALTSQQHRNSWPK